MLVHDSTLAHPLLRISKLVAGLLRDRVVIAIVALFGALAVLDPAQLQPSAGFLVKALVSLSPVLALSVALAAALKATGADQLVSHAFSGRTGRAIAIAALAGALSPLCSCGVVPLIAGLLATGVPLAPVMAFWLSSPVMDPVMFMLTAGTIGVGFAMAKTAAAIGVGLAGGWMVHLLMRHEHATGYLRNDGEELTQRRTQRLHGMQQAPVQWRFWHEPARVQSFFASASSNGLKLVRWLSLAFVLESLMLAYVPAESVATLLGGVGWHAIPLAVALGIPAYLNGLAAVPLVGGLIELGMSPAVGLAFMVAGGMTSIPAAMAVWALVKPRVFALYIALALSGSLAIGYLYAAWLALAGG